jgi:hypothetical protein
VRNTAKDPPDVTPSANSEQAPPAREPGCDDAIEVDTETLEQEAAETPPAESPTTQTRQTLISGIDLDSLGLDEEYTDGMEDEDAPVGIPVTKPHRDWFFRTHPTMWKNLWLLEVKDGPDRGHYIVARTLWKRFRKEGSGVVLRPVRLTLAVSQESGHFLWPLKLQEKGYENRKDEWSASALRICKIGETQWVKMYTRPGGNCYSMRIAEGITTEPTWPSQPYEELADLAFDGKVLKDADDPLLQRLQGKRPL